MWVSWTTTDFARRSANAQSTVDRAKPVPARSVVKSSQISLRGLAYAGSTDGFTGSGTCWKCGPAASPVAPHGWVCAWAP
ncbi:hypothetical protein ILP97_24120 [Amycolatopsis sp. H6(2020)]|nr:hypothetical protein [Amycolatopsis sp. H6(2020)]